MPFWSWVRRCSSWAGVPKIRSPLSRPRSNTSHAPMVTSATWAPAFVALEAHFSGQPAHPLKLHRNRAVVFTEPSTMPQPSMRPVGDREGLAGRGWGVAHQRHADRVAHDDDARRRVAHGHRRGRRDGRGGLPSARRGRRVGCRCDRGDDRGHAALDGRDRSPGCRARTPHRRRPAAPRPRRAAAVAGPTRPRRSRCPARSTATSTGTVIHVAAPRRPSEPTRSSRLTGARPSLRMGISMNRKLRLGQEEGDRELGDEQRRAVEADLVGRHEDEHRPVPQVDAVRAQPDPHQRRGARTHARSEAHRRDARSTAMTTTVVNDDDARSRPGTATGRTRRR